MSITADDLQNHLHSNHLNLKRGAFVNECFEKVSDHHDYKMWQEEVANIPLVKFASEEEKGSYNKISKEDIKHVKIKLSNANNSHVLKLSKANNEFQGVDSPSKGTFMIARQRSFGHNSG